MKRNRKTYDGHPVQGRLPATAIAMLVVLSSIASVACFIGLAQFKSAQNADSQIDGKLFMDDSVFQLKYVYAQRRQTPPPYKGAIVDLLITNQPLPEDLLTLILDEKYQGSTDLRSSGARQGRTWPRR